MKSALLFLVILLNMVIIPTSHLLATATQVDVVLVGTNICLPPLDGNLDKCTDYGQRPVYKVEQAFLLDRSKYEKLLGWNLSFIETYNSQVLVHERNVGKRVVIRGRVDLDTKRLEVAYYRFLEKPKKDEPITSPTKISSFYVAGTNYEGGNYKVTRSSRRNLPRGGTLSSSYSGWRDGGKNFRGLARQGATSSNRKY